MRIEDVPELVRNLIVKVRETYPTALIAGGYLRDLDNGREPKDIDLFIEEHQNSPYQLLESLGKPYTRDQISNVRFWSLSNCHRWRANIYHDSLRARQANPHLYTTLEWPSL